MAILNIIGLNNVLSPSATSSRRRPISPAAATTEEECLMLTNGDGDAEPHCYFEQLGGVAHHDDILCLCV